MAEAAPQKKPSSDETTPPQEFRKLLKAAYDDDVQGVISALKSGVDVNAFDPGSGLTVLHIAIGTNNLALTRILVEDWKPIFGPDAKGRWPSIIAAECRVNDELADYVSEAEAKAAAV